MTERVFKMTINEMISTHTLTWSVTYYFLSFYQHHHISTHTLTWSVTYQAKTYERLAINFNSHAHVERDSLILCFVFTIKISTHTLTWSVTKMLNADELDFLNFNSHAHVERDLLGTWYT